MYFSNVVQMPDPTSYSKEEKTLRSVDVTRKRAHCDDDQMICGMATATMSMYLLDSEILLHKAARENNTKNVQLLLSKFTDANVRNNLDRTALQIAAANGNNNVMTLLLKANAKIELQDKYGMRAVLWAAWFGHVKTLEILAAHDANLCVKNKQEMTILHCAAQSNHVKIIDLLKDRIKSLGISLMAKDRTGKTALHLAVESGSQECVEKLLTLENDINAVDENGQTVLHMACTQGTGTMVDSLLQHGSSTTQLDNNNLTPLHLASKCGHIEAMEALLKSSDSEQLIKQETPERQEVPLHLASSAGKTDAVTVLLQCNASDVNQRNYQSNTPLHLAVLGNHIGTVDTLVKSGADLNLQNYRLQTPLHTATENSFTNVVDKLLVSGADINIKDRVGKTALYLARSAELIAIVDMLIRSDRYYAKTVGGYTTEPIGPIPSPKGKLTNQRSNTSLLEQSFDPPHSSTINKDHHSTPIIADLKEKLHVTGQQNIGGDDTVHGREHKDSDADSAVGSLIGIEEQKSTTKSDVTDNGNNVDDPESNMCSDTITEDREENKSRHHNIPQNIQATDIFIKEIGELSFRKIQHPYATIFQNILWILATKQLYEKDWKKLARYWHFTMTHVRAIEHQHTGKSSWKEHGYRLLMTWLHGVPASEHPIRQLYEALEVVGRPYLAERIRQKVNGHGCKKQAGCVVM